MGSDFSNNIHSSHRLGGLHFVVIISLSWPHRRFDQRQRAFHFCRPRSGSQIPQCRQFRLLPLLSQQPVVPVVAATLRHVGRDALWPQPPTGGLQEQPLPQPAAQRHRRPHHGVQPGPARQQVLKWSWFLVFSGEICHWEMTSLSVFDMKVKNFCKPSAVRQTAQSLEKTLGSWFLGLSGPDQQSPKCKFDFQSNLLIHNDVQSAHSRHFLSSLSAASLWLLSLSAWHPSLHLTDCLLLSTPSVFARLWTSPPFVSISSLRLGRRTVSPLSMYICITLLFCHSLMCAHFFAFASSLPTRVSCALLEDPLKSSGTIMKSPLFFLSLTGLSSWNWREPVQRSVSWSSVKYCRLPIS